MREEDGRKKDKRRQINCQYVPTSTSEWKNGLK